MAPAWPSAGLHPLLEAITVNEKLAGIEVATHIKPRPASARRSPLLWDDRCLACRRVLQDDSTGNFCDRKCQIDFLRRKHEAQMEAELSPA